MPRTPFTPRIPLLLLFFSFAAFTAHAQADLPEAIHPSPEVFRPIESQKVSQIPSQNSPSSYQPLTAAGRFKWFVKSSIGPESLAVGLFTASHETARNNPDEYGPHWDGFGKRDGIRLTSVATKGAIEASLGSLWGEDPRYFRASPNDSFNRRVKHVVKLTFVARRTDGNYSPAYARFVAVPAANFLSNTWRVDAEATTDDAIKRTLYGFLARMAGNALKEFLPDLIHHHNSQQPTARDSSAH
ncbi:MAG: hypothetical protein ACRD4K_08795 [Candidatus Acidiferrales bacterium]